MQAAPSYRWGLGFIAKRWRHVFWLLPPAALFIGLGPLLWTLYGPTATGAIQVGFRHYTFADAERALVSDKVISRTVDSLRLTDRWGVDSNTCALKLRRIISLERVRGTSLLEVHISGKRRVESIEIWKALIFEATLHFSRMETAKHDAWAAPLEARLDRLKSEIDRLKGDTEGDERAPDDQTSQRIKDLEKDRSNTFHELFSMPHHYGDPIVTHEDPHPSPSLFDRDIIQSVAAKGGVNGGIGIIAAVAFAYLLELLFPSKHKEQH